MNWRLDNPPTIDVSVSRHMGLFAVSKLAERHGVRVRLRPALPQGLSALVWLPDSLIERTAKLPAGGGGGWSRQVSARPTTAEVPAYAGGPGGATNGHASVTSGHASVTSGHASVTSGHASVTSASPTNGSAASASGYGSAGARMPSGWFRRGQAGNLLPAAAGAGAGLDAMSGLGDDGGAAPYAERANLQQSTAGLPVRVPKASRGPGSGPPDGPVAGLPGRMPGGPAAGLGGGNTLPQRSPDQARSRLAGFQRGTRRAEGQGGGGGKAPLPGEGTER
jgi:hypothetical protein